MTHSMSSLVGRLLVISQKAVDKNEVRARGEQMQRNEVIAVVPGVRLLVGGIATNAVADSCRGIGVNTLMVTENGGVGGVQNLGEGAMGARMIVQ